MKSRIDVRQPIFDLCAALELDPENVARITVTPTWAKATVYKLDGGAKYVDPETNRPAQRELVFDVTTV